MSGHLATEAMRRTAPVPTVPQTPDLFRQGMRRLAGACTIITSVAPGQGREGWVGMTATAVASVTADPARLLVCINRSTWAHGVVSQSRSCPPSLRGPGPAQPR
jgi:flavin reductase